MSILNWGLIIMALKRKRIFRRILAPVLILAVCFSCFAVTALANTYSDLGRNFYFDLLSFSSGNNSGNNYFSFYGSRVISYDVPSNNPIYEFDMTIYAFGNKLSDVKAGYDSSHMKSLSITSLGKNYYKVKGNLAWACDPLLIEFINTDSSLVSHVSILSLDISFQYSASFPEVGAITSTYCDPADWVYMSSASSPAVVHFDYSKAPSYADFRCQVYVPNWQRYDYLDVLLYCDTAGINSLNVLSGSTAIPFTCSYLDNYAPNDQFFTDNSDYSSDIVFQWVMVSIDLTQLSDSSEPPQIFLTGTVPSNYQPTNVPGKIQLTSVTGYLKMGFASELTLFRYWLEDTLASFFGGTNDQQQIIDTATQTQVELNQKVNVEVTNAVTNWNASVDTLSGGVNNAISGSQVPLAWMSMLADKIFTNMGWFGNIYFTCGFLSVFLLILSKSGLVGRVKSSFQSNSPRSTGGGSKGNNTSS